MANRTVLIIAHRLSTIKKATKIALIDDGNILEIGNHEKLMKTSKHYKNLVALQS